MELDGDLTSADAVDPYSDPDVTALDDGVGVVVWGLPATASVPYAARVRPGDVALTVAPLGPPVDFGVADRTSLSVSVGSDALTTVWATNPGDESELWTVPRH